MDIMPDPRAHVCVPPSAQPASGKNAREEHGKTRANVTVVLIGLPGAGKGTQAQVLADEGWSHINVGGLVRSEVAANTEWGARALAVMDRGDLVPSHEIQDLIARELENSPPPVIIEGYPRRLKEASSLPELCGHEATLIPVFLEIPEAAALVRIAERVLCDQCGRVTSQRKHSACPKCGGPLITRADDKSEKTIERRIRIFEQETIPLLKYYLSQDELVIIDALRDEATIHREIKARISDRSRRL